MYGCQQQLIHVDDDTLAVLEFICSQANKLTNCAIYYCRQMFFKAHKYVSNYELDEIMKSNLHFKVLRSAVAQQSCHKVNDELPTYGETPKREHRFTGKRGQKIKGKLNNLGRGGYLTDDGIWLNSDCLGAINIIRKKVLTQLKDVSLARVDKGVLSRPHRYDVFKNLSKSYRIRCYEACLQTAS